ncbi:MAG: carboxypeptidase-like regulatory domain-containing protein [Clostridium sp.]|uniref:carboxypeptidase-like regulatory domain-containing protein n=1 Tax=Clostridium sp. TaxID=1506 RepID=UPI003056CBDC
MSEQLIKVKSTTYGDKHIDAIVETGDDKRAVIYGRVIDKNNKPVSDAVVKLILLQDHNDPLSILPITHTFTDEYGQFLFGPLPPNQTYLVKIWHDDIFIKSVTVKEKATRHSCITIRETVSSEELKRIKKLPVNHSGK